jgi:putative SOS response-associated peptidase YedK
MCVNYETVSRQIAFDWFRTPLEVDDTWREEIYRDFKGLFIVHDQHGRRQGKVGTYGFVPQRHRPFKKLTPEEKSKFEARVEKARANGKPEPKVPRINLETMNARAEEVGSKVNYKRFWLAQQLCIVPATRVFEPNWETGLHERWAINLASGEPFGLPGMWRAWEEEDGTITNSFTHFTLNSDEHPLLRRFHRPNEEKRGVAILRPENYDDWLSSKNPEFARALIELYRPEELNAFAAPKVSGAGPSEDEEIAEETAQANQPNAAPEQGSLFNS